MDANMIRRVAFAVIAIPLVAVIAWFGSWPLAVLLATAAILGTLELYGLAAMQGLRPFRGTGLVAAVGIPLLFQIALVSSDARVVIAAWWVFGAIGLVFLVMTQALAARGPAARPLAAVAVTLFGIAYATVLPSMLFYIRHARSPAQSWAGAALVFFPLIVTWVSDTAAMLGGRLIGGPKLAPVISPGKTRAGAVAGLIGGTGIGIVYAMTVFSRTDIVVGTGSAALLAATISILGQVGDLAESLLKREAGVKDSSTLIPGHGGVLDRLDSLYWAIPAAAAGYYLLGLI